MIQYQFPPHKASKHHNLNLQLRVIIGEALEALNSHSDAETLAQTTMEVMDVYHACETFLRQMERIEGPSQIHQCQQHVIAKNRERGYYE